MAPAIITAFLVCGGALTMLLVLGVTACIVNDYYNYKELQEKLERQQYRKQAQKEEP